MSSPDPPEESLSPTNKFAGEAFGPPNVRTVYAGAEDDNVSRPSRVFLLVGPSGAGKSSLIDFMCNYFYGASLDDDERYKIANEKFDGSTPDKSIITYIFNAANLEFRPIIVDTPGTGNSETRQEVNNLLRTWFEENSKMRIDAVGVVLSATNRLTSTEDQDLITTLGFFPPSVRKNMVVIATGSDGSPINNGLLRRFQLQDCPVFKVNNSCLYKKKQEDALKEHLRGNYWKMTEKNFSALFEKIKEFQPSTISGSPYEELVFDGIPSINTSKTVTTIVSSVVGSSTTSKTMPGVGKIIQKPLSPPPPPPSAQSTRISSASTSKKASEVVVTEEFSDKNYSSSQHTTIFEKSSDGLSSDHKKRRSLSSPSTKGASTSLNRTSSNSSINSHTYSVTDHTTGLRKSKSVIYNSDTYGTSEVHGSTLGATSSFLEETEPKSPIYPPAPPPPPQCLKRSARKSFEKDKKSEMPAPATFGLPLDLLGDIRKSREVETPQSSVEYQTTSTYNEREIDEYIARKTRESSLATSSILMSESELNLTPARSETLTSDSSQATVINRVLSDTAYRQKTDRLQTSTFDMIDREPLSLNVPPRAHSEVRVQEHPHGQTVIKTSTVPLENGYSKTVTKTSTYSYGADEADDLRKSREYLDRYSRVGDLIPLSDQLSASRYELPPSSFSTKYETLGADLARTENLSRSTQSVTKDSSSRPDESDSPLGEGAIVRYVYDVSSRSHKHHYVSRGSSRLSVDEAREKEKRYSRTSTERQSGDFGGVDLAYGSNRDSGVYAYGTLPRLHDSSRVELIGYDNKESLAQPPLKESCVDDSPPPTAVSQISRETNIGYSQQRKLLNETLIDDPAVEVNIRQPAPIAFQRNSQSRLSKHNLYPSPTEEPPHRPPHATMAGVVQVNEQHRYGQVFGEGAIPNQTIGNHPNGAIGHGAQGHGQTTVTTTTTTTKNQTGYDHHGHAHHRGDGAHGFGSGEVYSGGYVQGGQSRRQSNLYDQIDETQTQYQTEVHHGRDQEQFGFDQSRLEYDRHQAQPPPQNPIVVPRIIDENAAAMANSAGAEGVYKPPARYPEFDESGQRISQMYTQIHKPPLVPSHGSRYENLPLTGLSQTTTTTSNVQMRDKSTRDHRYGPSAPNDGVDVEMQRREEMLRQTRSDVQRDSYMERMAPTVHKRRPQPSPRYEIAPQGMTTTTTTTKTTEGQNNYIIPQGQKASSQEQLNRWGNEVPPYHERYPDPTQDPNYQKQRNLAQQESDDWDTESDSPNKVQRIGYVEKTTTRTTTNKYQDGRHGKKPAHLQGPLGPEHLGPETDPRSPTKGEFERAYPVTPVRQHANTEDRAYLVELQPLRQERSGERKSAKEKKKPQRIRNRTSYFGSEYPSWKIKYFLSGDNNRTPLEISPMGSMQLQQSERLLPELPVFYSGTAFHNSCNHCNHHCSCSVSQESPTIADSSVLSSPFSNAPTANPDVNRFLLSLLNSYNHKLANCHHRHTLQCVHFHLTVPICHPISQKISQFLETRV